jgi:glycosyltransferase involved in cell wall biosynthesis
MFNYIITIHNKQDLLPRVLEGIAGCCSKQSKIIPVLDGCTDGSEAIVDQFIAASGLNVEKVMTPDVYEHCAINAGMARVTEGFIMTIQDDVILQEPELEQKVTALCAEVGPTVGVISPRHGANVRRTPFLRQLRHYGFVPLIDEYERVTRPEEAGTMGERVEYGQVVYRMVAGGSPMIFPERVWKSIRRMDEAMAPLNWADHEYNLRALQAGFRNAVFPLHFESDVSWGTMRQKAKDDAWVSMVNRWTLSNRRYVWKKHGRFINLYNKQQGKPAWVWK